MVKRILFLCKHNVFRSQVAEEFFKKMYMGKHHITRSAGIIPYTKKDLIGDEGFEAEKTAVRKFGIKLDKKPEGINSRKLKDTDILVVVADDVPVEMIKKEKCFRGKLIVWKIPDLKHDDKNKEKIAEKSIKLIENKVKGFVRNLK
ncbi:MAG TPA: hypothetical protein VJZ93_03295 [Candidatus Nanoarchaeia archaeon]|nr:hypothetical protein [Candidatus Nanoarchaeia archaeon]